MIGCLVIAGAGTGGLRGEGEDAESRFEKEIQPIFVNYCYDCHGDGVKEGHLALDGYGGVEEMIADRTMWRKIRDHIDFRLMPPPDEFAPGDAERARLVEWIDDAVFHVDPSKPDPGHVTLRRLNRAEYANTIRDLLGVEVNVKEILPVDDSGYGFDTIGDVLTLSPLHLERYLEAAGEGMEKAVDFSPQRYPRNTVEGEKLNGDGDDEGTAHFFATNGTAVAEIPVVKGGTYRIIVSAIADQAGAERARMGLSVDGEELEEREVEGTQMMENVWEVKLGGGKNAMVGVSFLNDFYDETVEGGGGDRNLRVETVTLEGPLEMQPFHKSETHRALFPERGKSEGDRDYLLRTMGIFLNKAFRRPVGREEVERYAVFLKVAEKEDDAVEQAVFAAMSAALVSPSFLFREEAAGDTESGGIELLDEHALATRLSYFLWSSMPDAKLRELADRGELRENLEVEIARMVASSKSEAFVENFIGQWLQLRDMDAVAPNQDVYPGYKRETAGDMKTETQMLVREIMKENLPMDVLLEADFTFLNERLAKEYGIGGVAGEEFRKVSLEGTPRRGLLGQGSFLTLTSHSRRTSPVLRGKYILENLLDMPPPPAPPNVAPLADGERSSDAGMTLREELEEHRRDPACASCHALMDPLGFALENFDGVGRWRTEDRGQPINAAAKFVTGRAFEDGEGMREILMEDFRPQVHRAIAVKMLTYGLGRGIEYFDRPAIDGIVLKAGKDGGRFLSWITAVVESVPFQYRRGE